MAVNSPHSPRQKMINVMYLVFIAMLALNVSVEVLDGFKLVDDSLKESSTTLLERNQLIMDELAIYNDQNPEKAGEWYKKGVQVRSASDSLSGYIHELKSRMVRHADGKRADINNIKRKDNTEAASVVMLSPLDGEGKTLRKAIDTYREMVTGFVTDPSRRSIIEKNLSTTPRSGHKSWEASLFEQMPLAAAITLLTKIENDIRSSEGEALVNLLHNVDGDDFRMNRLIAHLIPESDIVMQGDSYNARVILAAEDTTHATSVYVNGNPLAESDRGQFSIPASRPGTYPVEGYLEMEAADGTILRHPFSSNYTVIEPMASIAPALTNVLYAGIDNRSASLYRSCSRRRAGHHDQWFAQPQRQPMDSPTVSRWENVSITVSVSVPDGSVRRVAVQEFRTRALPDPTPYILYTDGSGRPVMFKGGSLSKSVLMNTQGIEAAIDDGILSVPFQVISFRTVFFDSMGNAIPEISNGKRFSERQKEQIRRLPRGSYFYISGVRATGPDGLEREIAVMEVRVQ